MEELKDFLIIIIMVAILIAGFTILLLKIDNGSNSINSNNFVIRETLRQQTRNLLFRR